MKAWPTLRILTTRLMLAAAPLLHAVATHTQQPGASARPARFSLEIGLPQNVIRGDSEILLEVTMTNTSHEALGLGVAFAPPLWTRLCQLDVRDSQGKKLAPKPAMRQFSWPTESGPLITLWPGKKAKIQVMLNRVYDLSAPGQYTIQALRADDGLTVRSNILTASFGVSDLWPAVAKPPFSVALSTPFSAVKAGYQVPFKVAVKNTSSEELSLRAWLEDTGVGAGTGHEFASGIHVRDQSGGPAQRTTEGRSVDDGTAFPPGFFTLTSLKPGDTWEETRLLGKLYDISRPGTYLLQVGLSDPRRNRLVRSNSVAVRVLDADDSSQVVPQPPFTLNIRPIIDAQAALNIRLGLYLAITNRSDHPISFDIGFGDDDVDVFDSPGRLARLTKTGRRYRGLLRTAAQGGTPIQRLKPGETVSGGVINLEALYDLSRAGVYTVQLRAMDDETGTIVTSNRFTIKAKSHSPKTAAAAN
jgi:hypothetical protein